MPAAELAIIAPEAAREADTPTEVLVAAYEQALQLHRDDPVRRAAYRRLAWRVKELQYVQCGGFRYLWSDADVAFIRSRLRVGRFGKRPPARV